MAKTVALEDKIHKKAKLQSTKEGKSIKDYLQELIGRDLEKKEK